MRTTALGLLAVEVVVLVLWAVEAHSGSDAAATLRLGVDFWLAAHHTGFALPQGHLGVTPWTLTALPATLLWRGARRQVVAGANPIALTAAVAVAYGLLTALLCIAGRTPVVTPLPVQALVGGGLIAAAAAGGGAWRAASRTPELPGWLVPSLRGGLLAVGATIAAAAFAAAVGVGLHHAQLAGTSRAVAPSVSGSTGLALLDVLAAPHAVVWTGALLLGPGFGVGAHTAVSLAGVSLGATPALPLFAALPAGGAFPFWVLLLLALPVGAGVLAGVRATRGAVGAAVLLGRAAGVGVVAAIVWAALAWLADGPAGPGRLAVTGPSPWRVGLAALLEVGGGALMVGAIRGLRVLRARR